MFEHFEAVPTPPGGGKIDHSLSRPAHLALCHDIRYSRCLPENVAPVCVDDDVRTWQRVDKVVEPIVHVPSAATVDYYSQPAGDGVGGCTGVGGACVVGTDWISSASATPGMGSDCRSLGKSPSRERLRE